MPPKTLLVPKEMRAWMFRLQELLTWAELQFANHPLPDDLVGMVIAQQAGGVHRLARAVLAQIRGGSSDQLESRMRALVESAINVRYILAGDSEARALAFVNADVVNQKTIANHFASLLRRNRAPSMAQVTTVEFWDGHAARLQKELAEIETVHGRVSDAWPPILQRAEKGESDELYATLFRHFSEDEHLTPRGLDKHMRVKGQSVYLDFSQDLSHLPAIIGMTYVYYLTTLKLLGRRTGFPVMEDLQRFDKLEREIREALTPMATAAARAAKAGAARESKTGSSPGSAAPGE